MVIEKVEPQARFEFTLHGADVHEVSRPPPLCETTVMVDSYQGGDLTSLSYWGFHMTIKDCHFRFRKRIGDKDFYRVLSNRKAKK